MVSCRRIGLGLLVMGLIGSTDLSAHSRAKQQTTDNAQAMVQQLDKLIEAASFKRATIFAQQLLLQYPHNAYVHLSYARLLRTTGRTDRAMQEYSQTNHLNDRLLEPLLAMAQMSLENLEIENTIKYAHAALNIQPSSEQARVLLINALMQSDRLSQAENELALAWGSSISDRSATTLNLASQIAERKGDFNQARIYLQSAVNKEPQRTDWLLRLCQLLENNDDEKAARSYLEKLIRDKPHAIEPRLHLARDEESFEHNYDQAIALYTDVLTLSPTNAQALAGIDRCLGKKNNLALRIKLALQTLSKGTAAKTPAIR